jgi:hypothetical protein
MATLGEISAGLRSRLQTITDLRVFDVWPSAPQFPMAWVKPSSGSYHENFGGGAQTRHRLELHLGVTLAQGLERAQRDLEQYLAVSGPRSVKAAIEEDGTLGGVADATFVLGYRNLDVKQFGEELQGTRFLGVVLDVEVHAG